MKAVMYEGIGDISIMDVKEPEVKDDSILIKTIYSFICSTDIKTVKRGHPMIKPPTVLGHEASGQVMEVGKDVTFVKPGDYVAAIPYVNCGTCEQCIKGNTDGCRNRTFPSNGALAEYFSVSEDYAKKGVAIVKKEKLAEGALAEPLACVLTSADHMDLEIGDTALIVGAGIMGMLNAVVLKSVYGITVSITDTNTERLTLPKSMGFDVLTPQESLLGQYNSVVLSAPIPELILAYQSKVKLFGNMVLFGGYPKGTIAKFDPNIIHYNGVKILGTTGFSPKSFKQAISLLNNGNLSLAEFAKNIYSFDDFEKAFDDAMNSRVLKAGIKVGEPDVR